MSRSSWAATLAIVSGFVFAAYEFKRAADAFIAALESCAGH